MGTICRKRRSRTLLIDSTLSRLHSEGTIRRISYERPDEHVPDASALGPCINQRILLFSVLRCTEFCREEMCQILAEIIVVDTWDKMFTA